MAGGKGSEVVEIERAIKFLIAAAEKSGKSTKPMLLHGLRTGLYLKERGYGKEVAIAGLLHDLLEDAGVPFGEIERAFGKRVAALVQAASFDPEVTDKKERYQQTLERCKKLGKDALVVKAADILDNSSYYVLVKDREHHRWLLEKMGDFIAQTEELLKGEVVWEDLKKKHRKLTKGSGG